MSFVVKATEKNGKGELSIATVGYPLKQGAMIVLGEEDFYKQDIQNAIARGFLSVEQGEPNHPSRIKIVNKSGAPISIGEISLEPNGFKLIPEELKHNPNIQDAINFGLISIDDGEKEAKKTTKKKSTKKTAKKKVKQDTKKEEKDKEEISEVKYKDSENNTETQMQAWDIESEKMLDTEKSAQKVGLQQNMTKANEVPSSTVNEEGIQTGKVDFTGSDEEAETKAEETSSKKKSSKKKKTASSKSIKPVGKKRKEATADGVDFVDGDSLPNEGGFVDIEQAEEAIEKHPNARLANQNQEIDFIDE